MAREPAVGRERPAWRSSESRFMGQAKTVALEPGKRVLFLTKDPDLIRRQLRGELDLTMDDITVEELLDDILSGLDLPISRAEEKVGKPTSSSSGGGDFGSFARRFGSAAAASSAAEGSGADGGSFVIHGADGRGGRTKVIRAAGSAR